MSMNSHDEFLAATLPSLDLVYNLSRRMVSGPNQVEDLVQETFLRAYAAWAKGRKPRKVEAWLATICLNLGRSWLRKASTRREFPSEIEDTVRAGDDVERTALSAVTSQHVHDALWELPEEQRIAITLMDLNGFTATEASKIAKCPRGTILSRVHRGRKKLAVLLAAENDEVRDRGNVEDEA